MGIIAYTPNWEVPPLGGKLVNFNKRNDLQPWQQKMFSSHYNEKFIIRERNSIENSLYINRVGISRRKQSREELFFAVREALPAICGTV